MTCRDWDDNDNDEEDDNSGDDAHAHLHVLPPHCFPHTIGAASETLSGNGEVVGFVLEGVESFAALGDLVDVVAHDAYRAVDFLLAMLVIILPTV
jgi:hypothetical protein